MLGAVVVLVVLVVLEFSVVVVTTTLAEPEDDEVGDSPSAGSFDEVVDTFVPSCSSSVTSLTPGPAGTSTWPMTAKADQLTFVVAEVESSIMPKRGLAVNDWLEEKTTTTAPNIKASSMPAVACKPRRLLNHSMKENIQTASAHKCQVE